MSKVWVIKGWDLGSIVPKLFNDSLTIDVAGLALHPRLQLVRNTTATPKWFFACTNHFIDLWSYAFLLVNLIECDAIFVVSLRASLF